MKDYSEYNVPEFFVDTTFPTRYDWWCWHPLWEKWVKSCWGGATEEAAFTAIKYDADILEAVGDPHAHKIDLYHNKLIRHSVVSGYEEVYDMPCKKTDAWDRCLELKEKGLYRNNDIL
jgi:hypothetical protein